MPRQRIITFFGLIAAGLLLLMAPGWCWALGVVAIAMRLQIELAALTAARGLLPPTTTARLAGLAVLLSGVGTALWLTRQRQAPWPPVHAALVNYQAATLVLAFMVVMAALCWQRRPAASMADLGMATFSLLYAGWLPSYWALFRLMPHGQTLVSVRRSSRLHLPHGHSLVLIYPGYAHLPKARLTRKP
jgi:CDP-diglyceride synthetase